MACSAGSGDVAELCDRLLVTHHELLSVEFDEDRRAVQDLARDQGASDPRFQLPLEVSA